MRKLLSLSLFTTLNIHRERRNSLHEFLNLSENNDANDDLHFQNLWQSCMKSETSFSTTGSAPNMRVA